MQGQNYNPYTGAPLSGIDPPADYPQKSRIAAGLFGMLMGTFGVQILEGKIKMDANGIKLKD